jgi:hypothetical protein
MWAALVHRDYVADFVGPWKFFSLVVVARNFTLPSSMYALSRYQPTEIRC